MKYFLAILLSSLILIHSDARYIKRNTKEVVEEKKSWCSTTTPCGWEVYKPYVKTPEYFLKSPCECRPGERCQKNSDDISISAYVYLCSNVKQL
ncbi:hypothetical protein X975_06855, partial [Stegodyphus mimosarum]